MKTLKAYNKKQSHTVKSKLLLILMATKQSQPDDDDSVACSVALQKICSSEREYMISRKLQTCSLNAHIYRRGHPWAAKTLIRMPCQKLANKVAALQLQEICSLCDMHLLQTQCTFHMCNNKRAPIYAVERPSEKRSWTQTHTHTHSLIHSLTHSLAHSHSNTHPHSLTHSLTH